MRRGPYGVRITWSSPMTPARMRSISSAVPIPTFEATPPRTERDRAEPRGRVSYGLERRRPARVMGYGLVRPRLELGRSPGRADVGAARHGRAALPCVRTARPVHEAPGQDAGRARHP